MRRHLPQCEIYKFTTFRLFFAIAATENPELHQMEVEAAFLSCNLSEHIFMDPPEGFINFDYSDHVSKLLDCTPRT